MPKPPEAKADMWYARARFIDHTLIDESLKGSPDPDGPGEPFRVSNAVAGILYNCRI